MDLKDLGIKFTVVEVLFLFALLTAAGILINPSDPLFIHSSINPFVILNLALTLFYGLTIGIISLLIFATASLFFYQNIEINFLLWNLLLVLVAGEFFSYWKRKIETAEEESKYYKDKLRKQTADFILLKLSHDQLEKHYLVKPASIRYILEKIKTELLYNEKTANSFLMHLLNEAFHIKKGSLYLTQNGKNFYLAGSIGETVKLDKKDPLFQEAIYKGETVYISQIEESSKYLAVIPLFNPYNEILAGVFLIKDIPFRFLNVDNILAINIALIWFISEMEKKALLSKIDDSLKKLYSLDFLAEIVTLKKLYTQYNIESYLVVFNISENHEDFVSFLEKKIRGIDVIHSLKIKDKIFIFVILPLSSLAAAEGFVNRLKTEARKIFGNIAFLRNPIFIKIDNNIEELLSTPQNLWEYNK